MLLMEPKGWKISQRWVVSLALLGCLSGGAESAEARGKAAPTAAEATAGSPISIPANTWTWVDFPGAKCANGTSTGIGVNLRPDSQQLVIFFEGGGACSDYQSCYVTGTATYITSGYGKNTFDNGKPYRNVPLFDQNEPRNPYQNASYVYVPYCTGDVHSGTSLTTLTGGGNSKLTYFVGYSNVSAYLDRLVPTFPQVNRVLVSGWSAGGFGSAFNWKHVADAFSQARVDLLDDSGPPFMPNGDKWSNWLDTWGIPIPDDCPSCATDPQNFINYYGVLYDDVARFGLLSYTNDSVISSYYNMTRREFKRSLYDMATESIDPLNSANYFFVDGSSHVMLDWDQLGPGGARLSDWINQMYNDDPAWKSVAP